MGLYKDFKKKSSPIKEYSAGFSDCIFFFWFWDFFLGGEVREREREGSHHFWIVSRNTINRYWTPIIILDLFFFFIFYLWLSSVIWVEVQLLGKILSNDNNTHTALVFILFFFFSSPHVQKQKKYNAFAVVAPFVFF